MSKQKVNKDKWMLHDIYDPGVSNNRVVTRSQTPFQRLKNTPSDLVLFSDPSRHNPPGKKHLMEVLKGEYGAVPRTVITKSTGKYMDFDEKLIKEVNTYKKQGSKVAKKSTSRRKSSKEVGASKKGKNGIDACMLHDIYETGVSNNRVVTRSQTPFIRLKNTPSDMNLFANGSLHNPPGKPHLMHVLKGEYGAVPRTVLTRSFGKYMDIDEKLVKEVNTYKNGKKK